MIIIEIKIEDRSKFKDFLSTLRSKIEGLVFLFLQNIPERYIPQFLMEWLDNCLTKRIQQLKAEFLKNTWRNIHLENVVNDINAKTQKEAPADD